MPRSVPLDNRNSANNGMLIGFLLGDISRYFKNSLEKAMGQTGLEMTSGELRTLSYIMTYENSRQSALAALMGVKSMTLSTYVDRLAANGLVIRRPDPSDRRANVVCLTDKAHQTLGSVTPIADTVYRLSIAGVEPSDIEVFSRCLHTMITNLRRSS